ncbi:hypothetical protein Tco_1211694 [Tanacetum coccineum]
MGMAPRNSTIRLNTRVSLKGLSSASLEISHYPGASSSPKSTPFTPNTDLVIPSPTAILAILQSITALAVARNPLPTSRGVSGSFSCRSDVKFFEEVSGIMFTHDPRSARASKGSESPNLQGRVNSPGSPIFAGVLP